MNAREKKDEEADSHGGGGRGILKSVVQAERLIQLALVLPAATLIGWAIGMVLDRWLGHHWISIAGLLVGAVAGFVEVYRVVSAMSKMEKDDGSE